VAAADPRRALALGQARGLGRARDLHRPLRLLDRAGLRGTDDGVRVGPRDRLPRAPGADRRGLLSPRGPVHAARREPHPRWAARDGDRDRVDRAPALALAALALA